MESRAGGVRVGSCAPSARLTRTESSAAFIIRTGP
jgi:hypothetical protein